MYSIAGKTAIVTGAGSGIGKAIALLFAKQGANVMLVDRNLKAVHSTYEKIGSSGSMHVCNVAEPRDIEQLFREGSEVMEAPEWAVDILVNSAGIAHVGNIEKTTACDLDRLYTVNVRGVFNMIQAVIPHMRLSAAGGGLPVIINLDSIAAVAGLPNRLAYSMSKGAVHAMTMATATDYIGEGIRCNSICPARIHTPFVDGFLAQQYPHQGERDAKFKELAAAQPLGRMGTPEEVAAMALYLASNEASFITGCSFPIDGGFLNVRN